MKSPAILILLILIGSCVFGQQRGKNSLEGVPPSERIYFGGGGAFGGGTDPGGVRYTYVSVSPLVGYMITRPFSMGAGVNYIYYAYPDINVSLHQYGISPYAQYRFGKLFAYAEYSMISVPTFDNTSRHMYTRLPVGLGFSQPIGGRASINAMALYDVFYKRTAVGAFPSPWVIRVFVTAGGVSM
jgi:hypothetical protein